MAEMDKLSYEIFSILETKFLFGYDDAKLISFPGGIAAAADGKVRILSIDGVGASDGLLAAAALARLETSLRRRFGDPSACISDFFDLAAGAGAGGVLAALLFSRCPDGRPLFSAEEALDFLSKNRKNIARRGIFGKPRGIFRRVFGDLTARDFAKPVLIPCYDLGTESVFMISRADAVESDGYNFLMSDVCGATCASDQTVELRSVDGRSKIKAIGAAGMANPAAAAITHVLNNKHEFPRVAGVEDLMVLSLGGGRSGSRPSKADISRIAADGAADMVDQAVAMAFGHDRTTSYIRIQADCWKPGNTKSAKLAAALAALSEWSVETVMFQGSKLSEKTNAERLELFSGELIKEQERRKRSTVPTVVIKEAVSPRTSSATTSTTVTSSSSLMATSSSL